MRSTAPAIAPLFRSEHQLALLAELFAGMDGELGVSELARRIGANEATVSREVERLVRLGILAARQVGRNKLVQADYRLPWSSALRQLVVQIAGALPLLAAVLRPIDGIDDACVFGSFAARYHGEPGPFPRDVDLLVVGSPDQVELYGALASVERQVGLEVHPVVVSRAEWESPEPESFFAEVKAGPLVPLRLTEAGQ